MSTIPAENFCATLAVNVDNTRLTDAQFRELVRNTLPIVQFEKTKEPMLGSCQSGKPPVPTEPQKCKFCDYEWPGGEDHACEYSSSMDDAGNLYISYCGHQECPMCYCCQGNEPTPDIIRAARRGREIRESSGSGPKHDGIY